MALIVVTAATTTISDRQCHSVIAVIEKEFLETFKKLEKLKAPGGKTYAEAIRAGEIDGTKLRKEE